MHKGRRDKIRVEPFLAFGNSREVFFKGRVITAYTQKRPSSRNNWLKNILASIRRYSGSSVPNVAVEITFQDKSYVVQTDQDGVFELQIGDAPVQSGLNETVTFHVVDERIKNSPEAHLEVLRYAGSIGVISDIDDTVIISHSTDLGRKFWLSVSKNAFTRRPLPGVSSFYRKLTENGTLPMFYVSSSDWSLFDLIKDFLRFRHIPDGPLLLKDKHINLKNVWKSGGGDHQHKYQKIEHIFDMYPEMAFYLIGDSGQQDPEIYANMVDKYPKRVKGVFIRLVGSFEEERRKQLSGMISMENFHFVETSEQAIEILEQEMNVS